MNSVKEAYDETNKFLSFLQAISMYKEGRISLEDLSLEVILICFCWTQSHRHWSSN